MKTKGGVDRTYGNSTLQKSVFILGHLIIVLFCLWLVEFDGLEKVGMMFSKEWHFGDVDRAYIMIACAMLYFVRHIITLFYLLVRKVEWAEVFGLLSFIAFFEIGLVLVGGGVFSEGEIPFNRWDVVALIFLLAGSFINTFSELQRKWWKKDSKNKGHCYTGGLFGYVTHVNYFGDVVLFSGWALLTYNYWTLGLPLLMAYSFIAFHIPALDMHLNERYGDEFVDYARVTKKLFPFIY